MANKKQFLKSFGQPGDSDENGYNVDNLFNRNGIIKYYCEKYFNLFMSSYEVKGKCLTRESRYYLLKKLYYSGTVAAFNIKFTDLIGFAPYSIETYDMYGAPATINLINERNSALVPARPMNIGSDAVIGWYQRNHLSLYKTVHRYAEQLADVQMVINTNLALHKMPFLIMTDDNETAKRIKDCIRRILNNELAVYLNAADKNAIASMNTATPYIIDKLYQYKIDLENELKTYLGLDNSGGFQKRERMLVDEVNSQRATIDDSADNFTDELNEFADAVKETLHLDIRFEARQKQLADATPHMEETAHD